MSEKIEVGDSLKLKSEETFFHVADAGWFGEEDINMIVFPANHPIKVVDLDGILDNYIGFEIDGDTVYLPKERFKKD